MSRLLDTIIGRTVLVSLIGITLMHMISLWSYRAALTVELAAIQQRQLAERLLAIRKGLSELAPQERERNAHNLSSGPLEVHWSTTEHAVAGGTRAMPLIGLSKQLQELSPELRDDDLIIGETGSTLGDPHVALVSMRLPDETWANVNVYAFNLPRPRGQGTLIATTFMALGVVALSILIASWLTRPIRAVAEAARNLHPGRDAARLPLVGPREVRELVRAVNEMQDRISQLMTERTRALAAVSHDLRTPLTRLRLRIDELLPDNEGEAVASDFESLERMIDDTLSYLKGDGKTEAPRPINVVALLRTISDEASDAGFDVSLAGANGAIVRGRHLGLKRALSNLVENATKYGQRARVLIKEAPETVVVQIDDDGPGIPSDKLGSVFEPFVRLEESRNRDTGGVGLGLTIAKANIEADGGSLLVENRLSGGLRVTIILPRHTSAPE